MQRVRWPRLRFSLRTLLLLCLIPVPLLAWVGNLRVQTARQQTAIQYLESRGFRVQRGQPPLPTRTNTLIRTYVHRNAFDEIATVGRFSPQPIESSDVDALLRLSGLRQIHLARRDLLTNSSTSITAEGSLSANDFLRVASIPTLALVSLEDEAADARAQLALAKLPDLHTLTLPKTRLTDEALQELGKSQKLSTLEFDASDIRPEGFSHLAGASFLQTLSLGRLPRDLSYFQEFKKFQALTTLQLLHCELSGAHGMLLSELRIQSLSLRNCKLTRGFFYALRSSKSLKYLYVQMGDCQGANRPFNLETLEYLESNFANDSNPSPSTPKSAP